MPTTIVPPEIPLILKVPQPGLEVKARLPARGVQIYDWKGEVWQPVGPEAELLSESSAGAVEVIGRHSLGPVWELQDGSRLLAKKVAAAPAPESAGAGAIAWLLLEVTEDSGRGVLAGCRFIQRVDTEGGSAGTRAPGADEPTQLRIPYRAVYYVWG